MILSLLEYKFDAIGISEHKVKTSLANTELTGCHEFIFQPTEISNDGTGYLKDNIDYIERNDFAVNSPTNFESCFVKILFQKKKNLIVGCIYRHQLQKHQ